MWWWWHNGNDDNGDDYDDNNDDHNDYMMRKRERKMGVAGGRGGGVFKIILKQFQWQILSIWWLYGQPATGTSVLLPNINKPLGHLWHS